MSYDIRENKEKIQHILVRKKYVDNTYSINNLYNIEENKFESSKIDNDKYIPENKLMEVVNIPDIGLTLACNALLSKQGLIPFKIEEVSNELYILVYNYNLKMRKYRLIDYLKTVDISSKSDVIKIWSIVNTLYINKEKIKNLLEKDSKRIANSLTRLSMLGESVVAKDFRCISIKDKAKYINIPEGIVGINLEDKDISTSIDELILPKTLMSIRNKFNSSIVIKCEKLTVYGEYIDYDILDRISIGELNVIGKATPDLVCWAYKNTNRGIKVEKEYEINQIVGIKKVCEIKDEFNQIKEFSSEDITQLRQLQEINALGAMVADGNRLGVEDRNFKRFKEYLEEIMS